MLDRETIRQTLIELLEADTGEKFPELDDNKNLREELGLELKPTPYLNRTTHGMDFLGCRVFRRHLLTEDPFCPAARTQSPAHR